MLLLLLKILIIGACGELWRQGGKGHKELRTMVIPGILSIYCAITLSTWWLCPALFATMMIYRIGYGEDSILYKICFNNPYFARGLAGLLYGVLGSLPVFIITHDWVLYGVYAVSNAIIGGVLDYLKVKDEVIERVIGGVVGTLVFYV